jgi:hypothetical protein
MRWSLVDLQVALVADGALPSGKGEGAHQPVGLTQAGGVLDPVSMPAGR